jgi:peptidyl-prolyl cis-trans isomerase SurA
MKGKILLSAFLLLFAFASGQTLFTYDGKNVSEKEFMRAFEKAHPGSVTNKEQIKEYLNLYINSRLKIHEAAHRGYDTLPAFVEEYNGLRNQVAENFMTDNETMDKLTEEAMVRSRKDIKVQHIFIPYNTSPTFTDSPVVKQKILQAHMELSNGKSFEETALKYSLDPSVSQNKGNLGYITVFTLPYQFENIIYSLPVGKFSMPYRSASGYHIFKNVAERKAVGKMKASQILLALPPGSDSLERKRVAKQADSLYQRLLKGDDFAKLATAFSNDVVSSASGGQMQEFSIGTYDEDFEKVVFALPANGALSKPFITRFGYHIVKRISLSPPPAANDKKSKSLMRAFVEKDARADLAKEVLYHTIVKKAGLTVYEFNLGMLHSFLDSALVLKQPAAGNTIKNEDRYLTVDGEHKNIGEFVIYARNNRLNTDGTGPKNYNQLSEEFKQQSAFDYYRRHLEEFNDEFRLEMQELKDGNLFFDIMMKEIWTKAQTDTAGQEEYFKRNKSKYVWKNSAEAVIFYCSDENTAKSLRTALLKNPKQWRTEADNYNERVSADSGRFEISKIPGAVLATAKTETITTIIKNKDDNSASFAYILKKYTQPAPKTIHEARGDVISDYQDELDRRWISELKKKYPVKMNETVLSSLVK